MNQQLAASQARCLEMEDRKDGAYIERNHLVAALARCFPSGIRKTAIEGWSDDWHGCVYIDLPAGQISYHYHDSQASLFDSLPAYEKPYDGHTKCQVHERLESAQLQATLAAREAEIDRLKLAQQHSIQDECEAEQRLIDAGISDYEDGGQGEYRGLLTQIDLCIKERDAAVQQLNELRGRLKDE